MEVGLLQDLLPVCVELVEFVLEELSHNSETGPIEEEIKLLIVLLLFSLSKFNLSFLASGLLLRRCLLYRCILLEFNTLLLAIFFLIKYHSRFSWLLSFYLLLIRRVDRLLILH